MEPHSANDTGRFLGKNLQVARHFHGLTQSDLAARVGSSTHAAIANYERGTRQPTPDFLRELCRALDFEKGFFFTPLSAAFNEELFNFRKRENTPLYTKNQAISHIVLFAALVAFFDAVLELPEPNIPEIRCETEEGIERAAETCRFRWSLGDRPVSSITRVVENAGAVVTRFDFDEEAEGHVDAFSHTTDRGIIVVNSMKGSSRTLFDLAHELGHLVMHGGMVTGTPPLEQQADFFASAFLLPRVAMHREFPRPVDERLDWDALFAFKQRWRVSVQATLRRAYTLQIISHATYHKAFKHISYKGWRKREPCESELERPELVVEAFHTLKQESGQDTWDVTRQLNWRPATMRKVAGVEVEDRPMPEEPRMGQLVLLEDVIKRRS